MAERAFLTAAWRHLLVLNYRVEPELLADRIPPGTSLDLEDGRCYLSVVAFRFERTRVCGLPVPLHTSFPEINLRFYVVRNTPEGPQRGVVFVRELVNRRAVAWLARRAYNEAYLSVPMRYDVPLVDDQVAPSARVSYAWRSAGRWHEVSAVRCGPWETPAADSHEAFIAEHYFGYGVARDGRTIEYRVAHPSWRACRVHSPRLAADTSSIYGERFATALRGEPHSAFLLDGSDITVYRPRWFSGEAVDAHREPAMASNASV